MISSKNRFHGHGSLGYLYRNGRATHTKDFTIKVIENSRRKHARVAIVVSKKIFKSAVKRNRIRRRMYEQVRPLMPKFKDVIDIVIIVTSRDVLVMPALDLKKVVTQSLIESEIML